jgi:hypothetical protein
MTDFEMPEATLIRSLRERLGDDVADACLDDFMIYLGHLGDTAYRAAWDAVSRDKPTDAEHILARAESRSRGFKGAALALNAYRINSRPKTLADAPPAWAAATQALLPMVPA